MAQRSHDQQKEARGDEAKEAQGHFVVGAIVRMEERERRQYLAISHVKHFGIQNAQKSFDAAASKDDTSEQKVSCELSVCTHDFPISLTSPGIESRAGLGHSVVTRSGTSDN